jgi:hypothetical protein
MVPVEPVEKLISAVENFSFKKKKVLFLFLFTAFFFPYSFYSSHFFFLPFLIFSSFLGSFSTWWQQILFFIGRTSWAGRG